MKPWKNDIAILCIFFARPEQFRQSFEAVRQARPKVLLLWQDGPRDGRQDDIEKIMECRQIAENIDWDCEIHKMYNEKNFGCDPSTFYSHKWAFSIVDKCIILEDDVIPAQSFFPFCKELLDKYENDERIDRICGLNILPPLQEYKYDYFFASNGMSCGWATWKRVADTWDEEYSFLDNEYLMDLIDKKLGSKSHRKYVETCRRNRDDGVAHWEKIISFSMLINSRIIIFPNYNQIANIGFGCENSTHAPVEQKYMSKKSKSILDIKTYEIDFPLKHPPYVIVDYHYDEKIYDFFNRVQFNDISVTIRRFFAKIIKGDFSSIKRFFSHR